MRFQEHPVVRLLRLFGDVRPGEAATVLLMMLNISLLLTAYYLLKVAREPLILLGGGAEVKSYSAVGQALVLVVVSNVYGWLAARCRRLVLVGGVTVFFAGNLVLFWFLGKAGVRLGVPFFMWVGVFNLVMVAQFWSFAADMYTEADGKRLFPVIGIGSSVGAIGGSAIADRMMRIGSPFTLMLLAAAILVASFFVTWAIHGRAVDATARASLAKKDAPVAPGNAFALVARDRFLVLIAVLILVLNISTKNGDYVLDRMLISHAADAARSIGESQASYIGQFKARYFEWINVLEIVLQSLFVSRIIKYAGIRVALIAVPVVSLAGYGAALGAPVLGLLFATRVAENGLDYSLSQTVRNALWLVTSREAKYKAKQVVDSFVWRAGDSLSAAIVWIGSHLRVSLRWFVAVNVVVAVTWITVAVFLGRQYARRAAAAPAT